MEYLADASSPPRPNSIPSDPSRPHGCCLLVFPQICTHQGFRTQGLQSSDPTTESETSVRSPNSSSVRHLPCVVQILWARLWVRDVWYPALECQLFSLYVFETMHASPEKVSDSQHSVNDSYYHTFSSQQLL